MTAHFSWILDPTDIKHSTKLRMRAKQFIYLNTCRNLNIEGHYVTV